MTLPYCLGAALFIWVLHPCGNTSLSPTISVLAAWIMTLLFVLSFGPWIYLWRVSSRRKVVSLLINKVTANLRERKEPPISALSDLMYLGLHSATSESKQEILTKLGSIPRALVGITDYSGSEHREFALTIEQLVLDESTPSNERNFRTCAGIVEELLQRAETMMPNGCQDWDAAIGVLCRVGERVMRDQSLGTALLFVRAVSKSPDGLFRLGKSALDAGQFRASLNALRKLETLLEGGSLIGHHVAEYYLGLVSHFYTHENSAIRASADSSLLAEAKWLSPNLIAAFLEAKQYFANTQRFDTAEKLRHTMLWKLRIATQEGEHLLFNPSIR